MVAAYFSLLDSSSHASIRVTNCVSAVRPTLSLTWRRYTDCVGVCEPVGNGRRRTIRHFWTTERALRRCHVARSRAGKHATSQTHAPVEPGQVEDPPLNIHSSPSSSSPPPSSQSNDSSTSSHPSATEESSSIESDSSLESSETLTEWLLCKEVALAEREAVSTSDAHVSTVSEDGGGDNEQLSYFGKLYKKVSPRMRGLILLNMLTLLYGSNMSVIKDSQLGLDPATFSVGRFAIATAAFLPFLGNALRKKSVRMAGIEMGIWAAGGYLTQAHALLTTEAGRASFISTITVVEVPLVAGLFGARVPPVTWLAAAAAVGGVSLLESGGSGGQNGEWYGEVWTLVSALMFGVHMLRSEYHSKHLDREDAIPLISLQLAVTCAISVAWALLAQGEDWGRVVHQLTNGEATGVLQAAAAAPWIPMIYTGLMSTALCLWIEVVSLRDVTATDAAMVYTLEPLYGAAFAWGLLGERWGWRGWAGAALILGGSVVMQVVGDKESGEGKEDGGGGDVATHSASAALAAAAVATILVGGAEPQGTARGEETSGKAAMESRRGEMSEDASRRGRGEEVLEEGGSGSIVEVFSEEGSNLSESCVEFGGERRGEEAEGSGQGGDLESLATVVRLQALRDVEGEGKVRRRGRNKGDDPEISSQ